MAEAYAVDLAFVQEDRIVLDRPTRAKPYDDARIVFYKRSGQELQFVSSGRVVFSPEFESTVSVEELGPSVYGVALDTVFDSPRELDVIGGSLQKTRNFLDPQVHFKQPIVALSDQDYSTIVTGDVDVDRSIFRILFHSLPLDLQAMFVEENAGFFHPKRHDEKSTTTDHWHVKW